MNNSLSSVNSGESKAVKSILYGVEGFLKEHPLDLASAIDQIKRNWNGDSRSKQNWRLRPVPLDENSGYKELLVWRNSEVLLERNILKECRLNHLQVWNQMPTASGLLPSECGSEGRRAIDLVYQPDVQNDIFEFIELKVARNKGASDTLRHATLEVLEYGLLYLFSRKYREPLGYSTPTEGNKFEVLNAIGIRLRVLAREDYYKDQDISLVPSEINTALKNYIDSNREYFGDLWMDFGFEVFSDDDDLCTAFRSKSPWPEMEVQN